jgi:hypothetical protein
MNVFVNKNILKEGSKTVTFTNDTKSYDGSSSKNIIYYNLIMNYFKTENSNELISQCLENKNLIKYFIKEARISHNRLKNIIIEQENNQIKNFFKIIFNFKNYKEDPLGDSEFYKKHSLKNKKGVAIIRTGCRDVSEKFLPKHLKKLEKFIQILEKIK